MADTNVEVGVISKITMATIGCKPTAVVALPEDQKELAIARLYGKLSEVRFQDDKTKGQIYTFFVGNFEAVNMQTGEVFKSGKMFLPKGISELVEDGVKKGRAADPNASISFAFQVNSIKANNPIGYSYKILQLKAVEPEDELKAIREIVTKAGTVEQRRLTGSQTGAGPRTIDQPMPGQGAGKKSA